MTTRALVTDDGTTRTYAVTDNNGNHVGTDQEPSPGTPAANQAAIAQRAAATLTANATYLAIGAPTNAQVATQVQLLTKECSALIRLLLNQVDSTSGT